MPTDQKAEARPIAFLLHDTVRGTAPIVHQLAIRPEDLSRQEPSRLAVHQTLGGAWLDDFGPGVTTINIAGHTGWGGGGRPDGFEEFKKLHETVFNAWHRLRAEVTAEGKDPDGVKLVFDDGLDGFTWCVAPQSFVLKRNRSRPLLSQYQISMLKLDDKVPEKPKATASGGSLVQDLGLDSLSSAIKTITGFVGKIKGMVASVLGPIMAAVKGFISLALNVLKFVQGIVKGGMDVVRAIASPIMALAGGITKAAITVMNIVSSIKSIPQQVKSVFMEVKSAFTNAFCLLKNVFKISGTLPNYDGLYGASNCSSTAGGRPLSAYADKNVFPEIFPATKSPVSQSSAAAAALNRLGSKDPLKVDTENPAHMSDLSNDMVTATGGTTIMAA